MNRALIACIVVVTAAVVTACGGDGGDDAAGTSTAVSTAGAAPGAALDRVVGTYTTKLGKGDGPAEAQGSWTVIISKSGGVNGAPSLVIRAPGTSEAFSTAEPAVDGDTFTVKNEECDDSSAKALVAGTYAYELTKTALRLTTKPGSERCEDRIVETILTAHALRRRS